MKIFNSIKGRLFIWLFAFISILLITVGISMYFKVRNAIFTSIDQSLNSEMAIVAGLLHFENEKIEFELSEVVSGEYVTPGSGHYYQVVLDGKTFAASQSLVDNEYDFTLRRTEIYNEDSGDIAYTSVGPAHETVRVMQHDFELLGIHASLFLAESIEESLATIERIKLFLFITIPVSIMLTGLISLLIVKQSLRPIDLFSGRVRNITHKNLNERIDSNRQTEELTRLAESFNEMLDRLQKAFEVEKRIISDASHELKTPLSVIKTQCDVILQRSRTPEEYIEAIDTVKSSGDSMSRLVNDLLSVARLDSGLLRSAEFQEVKLNRCLEEAVSVVKLLAEKNNVQINSALSESISIMGVKDRLTEAFLNIIENAVRYNRHGGTVDIAVSGNDNYVEILIQDTGTGIEENHLKRIFERFYRADPARSTEGTGLGLSITKAIIEAHGGAIKAESKIGEGTRFIINFSL